MLHIARLLLLLPYRISLFSIVPELLCQLRFAFLGKAFGKAICHTLLHKHMYVCVCVLGLSHVERGQVLRCCCIPTAMVRIILFMFVRCVRTICATRSF